MASPANAAVDSLFSKFANSFYACSSAFLATSSV